MNPIANLLQNLKSDDVVDDRTPEEIEAEEKQARKDWHRRNVRNGPARFTHISAGRQASKQRRMQEAFTRRANVKHRRRWMKQQHQVAILRGQLQAIGAVPYATDHTPTTKARLDAGTWIIQRFGERNDEGDLVYHDDMLEEAVKAALEAYAA